MQAGAPPRDALQAWFTTGSGLRSVQELRWALLAPRAAVARLQSAYPRSRLSADSFLTKMFENGGAVLQDSAPYWGPTALTWQAATLSLSSRCRCPPAGNTRILCCWTCGGAVLPVHVAGATTTASCTVLPAIAVSTSAGNAAGISVPMQRTAAQTPGPLCARTAGLLGRGAWQPALGTVVPQSSSRTFSCTSELPAL